ncbi:MAG: hypothetical protein Q7T41_00325 [Candidatus Saccharibacteria bacterium]|nr:hypothetical protein [Candidatus Saccharibacteria bacterium]
MSDEEPVILPPEEPEEVMSEERKAMLLNEAARTVGGKLKGTDPRDALVLVEQAEADLKKLLGGTAIINPGETGQ